MTLLPLGEAASEQQFGGKAASLGVLTWTEAVAAWEILAAMMDKLGGDTIDDTVAARKRVLANQARRLSK